jgi:hypothetical protein
MNLQKGSEGEQTHSPSNEGHMLEELSELYVLMYNVFLFLIPLVLMFVGEPDHNQAFMSWLFQTIHINYLCLCYF